MEKSKKTKLKRTYRSEVVLDVDDISILNHLNNCIFMEIDNLKQITNFSHKGLLVHLKRLTSHELINVTSAINLPEAKEKLSYKNKVILITPTGKRILNELKNTSKIKTQLNLKNLK